MKLAVSGAHRTGKTTLIAELSRALPAFSTVDEPYYLLEEEGHEFAEMPCLEDFELQLERSIESLEESEGDCLFDRCPSDILAYLISHDESDAFDADRWLARVRDAMKQLDLIVFVPIEDPDRVIISAVDHRRLRRRVDEELRDLVLEDRWSLGVPAIEVAGPTGERARQVLAHLRGEGEGAS
jgi:predicted ATPase